MTVVALPGSPVQFLVGELFISVRGLHCDGRVVFIVNRLVMLQLQLLATDKTSLLTSRCLL